MTGFARLVLFAVLAGGLLAGCARRAQIRGSVVPPAGLVASDDAAGPTGTVLWIEPREASPMAAIGVAPTVTIRLVPEGFAPRLVVVPAGTRLRLENRDRLYHTPFSVSSAARFRLEPLGPGQTDEVIVARSGEVRLFCELHSDATGVILVVPTRDYVRADSHGRFALPRLPHGHYTLAYWHPVWGGGRRPVDVPARGEVRLDVQF